MTISPPDASNSEDDLGPMHWGSWRDPAAPPTASAPARQGRRWITPVVLGLVSLLLVAVLASSFITLPYYAIAPGSARPVDDLVRSTDRSKIFPHHGEVLFATVTEYRARPIDAIHSWFNDNIELIPERRILGDNNPGDLTQINLGQMRDAKQTAIGVALRRIGIKEKGSGALVTAVGSKTAADGHLHPGDVILSIDGKPTMLLQDAQTLIRAHKAGDNSTLVVQARDSTATRNETVTYGPAPTDPKRARLGVDLETKDDRFDLPYTVSLESGAVGGPSAGLAFTLEVIDSLTPGELTGGRKVAVTGTIDQDGNVGPVGGVAQKTAAVKSAGAKYFLVPPDEYETAKAHAGRNLQVIKVTNLEQALDVLGSLGGDVAALGPAPATPRG